MSLHILDLAQNSITAGADLVEITINEDLDSDWLTISIEDNGKGMSEEFLEKVKDPFVTTRTSRRVGLGIPLMLAACRRCAGDLEIISRINAGTKLVATFRHSHIDRTPLGNMAETMVSLILCGFNEKGSVNFVYKHMQNSSTFLFDTHEIKAVLGEDVSLTEPDVLAWIHDYIKEGLANLHGGVQ